MQDHINIRESLENYSYHYKWFLLGVMIALATAFIFLRYATYQHEVSSTILIDDEDNSGSLTSELAAFKDLGLFSGPKASLDTEMGILKSRSLMERVIKNLDFQVSYFNKGRIGTSEIYKNELPLNINLLANDSIFRKLDTTFSITASTATQFILKDGNGNKIKEYPFGETIKCKFGDLMVTQKAIKEAKIGKEIIVRINPLDELALEYKKHLKIIPESTNSNLLVLTLQDPVKDKAQAILDNLINHYNRDAVEDKNKIAQNTDNFLNNRIEDIYAELTKIDLGEEIYKTDNKLTDMVYEAGLVLESNAELSKQIVELSSQIKLVDYVIKYLKGNKNELMPSNIGMLGEKASQNTLDYNRMILERNRIIKSGTTEKNPVLISLNDQIAQVREGIDQTLRNSRSSLAISLRQAKIQKNKITSRISAAPKKEREVRDIKRQQQIVETLYLYLLQKREENSISLAATAPIAKVIDKAYGSNKPVYPSKKLVYILALLLGLIVPFIIIYIRLLLDNKVHTVDDIEKVIKAPILGDIPTSQSEKKIIISEQDNSNVAESFRLLRTNVRFLLPGAEKEAKTIFVTSTIGGEGKTFTAINFASAMVLLNKKVLLIGADIRKPKIAAYLNTKQEKGLTHFLIDNNLRVSDVIEHHDTTNLDILETGVIPPNPSELLTNGRFDEVIAYGKANYDFVIVDTAPVNVVTDTLLLSNHADLFIYVVRANYLDKRLLKIPKMMNENNRLPNMAILINDTNYKKKSYGYGYGYGYSETKTKKPWFKKLFGA